MKPAYMKKYLFPVLTYIFFAMFFFLVPMLLPTQTNVHAQTPSQPCDFSGAGGLNLSDCYKLNQNQTVASVYGTPSVIINIFVRVVFILAGIIIFFLLIYAGYLEIVGGVKGQEQAMGVFSTAVIGLIVMFSAYWILQIIQLVTGAKIGF